MSNDDITPLFAEQLSATRNKFGFRGVSEDKPGRFRAAIGKEKPMRSNYYSTAKEAAEAYDRLAKRHYGERAYLNFPEENELAVKAVIDGFCKRGHKWNAQNTYVWGGKRTCRICNALSQARRKARRKKQT